MFFKNRLTQKQSDAERQVFEKMLMEDSNLKKEWQNYQEIHFAVLANELFKLKNDLKLHHQNVQKAKLTKWVLGFALLTASVTIFAVWQFQTSENLNDTLKSETQITEDVVENKPDSKAEQENIINLKPNPVLSQPKSNEQLKSIEFETAKENKNTLGVSNLNTQENLVTESSSSPKKNIENESDNVIKKTNDKVQHLLTCEKEPLLFELASTPSCLNDSSGKVVVNNLKGGKKPYKKWLTDEDGNILTLNQQLKPGKYIFNVEDSEKCYVEKSIIVETKQCPSHLIFNPNFQSTLTFPMLKQNGILSIFDQKGNLLLNKTVLEGELMEWDGRGSNGNVAEGLYHYTLKSEFEHYFGTITIKF